MTLDADAIMDVHAEHGVGCSWRRLAFDAEPHCLPYYLSAEVERLRAEVDRWKRAWQGEDRSHAETQAELKALQEFWQDA